VTMLLDGTEPHQMLDNISIDRFGNLLAQEDTGNNAYLARVWHYAISTGVWRPVAIHDQARFGNIGVAAGAGFNQDEESSGIFDASDFLGAGWWLLDVQAHATAGDTELVERGQLLALYLPEGVPIPTFTTGASASDTTPTVGDDVTFWAEATEPGAGAVIEYSWDFGDGSTAAGRTVSHEYFAAGEFTAVVTAKHAASGKTATSQVAISVARASNTTRAVVELDFGKSGKDRLQLVGQFPVSADFAPKGKQVKVDFGGVVRSFTLDEEGHAKSGDAELDVHLGRTKDGAIDGKAGWSLRIEKGDLRGSLADEGFTSTPTAGRCSEVRLETTLDGTTWDEVLDLIWVVNDKKGIAR
jgi:PKD repeat protein